LDGPAMQTLRFNRPAVSSYPHTILRTMMVGLSEPNIDLSVGCWKELLQQERTYMPESTTWPWKPGKHEKNVQMLRGAMKLHLTQWFGKNSVGVQEDGQAQYKLLQVEYNVPQRYQAPQDWLQGHLKDPRHCFHHRCVSVWWYYDQIVRDTPGFVNNFAPKV
jgi:hypothetical protein